MFVLEVVIQISCLFQALFSMNRNDLLNPGVVTGRQFVLLHLPTRVQALTCKQHFFLTYGFIKFIDGRLQVAVGRMSVSKPLSNLNFGWYTNTVVFYIDVSILKVLLNLLNMNALQVYWFIKLKHMTGLSVIYLVLP